MAVSNQEKGLVCICRANDSALFKMMFVAMAMLTNNLYSNSNVQRLCTFLEHRFLSPKLDDTEEIISYSLETLASLLPCIADSTGKCSRPPMGFWTVNLVIVCKI